MARNKKKVVDDLSRPEKRGPPGPSPLIVIAGLPAATALPAAATINNNRETRWRAVAGAFAKNDSAIYADSAAILELGRQACDFAIKGGRDGDGVPTPSRIVVAYVADPGFERLWDVFGHAVLPIPLRHTDWDWPRGRHWRHEIETVNRLVDQALRVAEGEAIEALRLRLEARRSDDVLLLPGRNFHLDLEHRLVGRFRELMSGQMVVADVEADISIERFSYERLKPFYNRVGGSGKKFAIDSRGIVFAKSNIGQHGGQHVIQLESNITAPLLQRTLESRYRFGTPLVPEGFQHDAQREKGAIFNNEWFECVIKGPRQFSGDHVNIFPSDVVT